MTRNIAENGADSHQPTRGLYNVTCCIDTPQLGPSGIAALVQAPEPLKDALKENVMCVL